MSARIHRLEGRWLQILRTTPVLPEIPHIADWLKAQELEITVESYQEMMEEIRRKTRSRCSRRSLRISEVRPGVIHRPT